MRHITVGDECWEWTGSLTTGGYGRIFDPTPERPNGLSTVHRVTYELFVGPVPEGLQLDHLCRNRRCVRPDHLEPVTTQENTRRGAQYRRKTHCPAGHPYNDDNTTYRGTRRWCRTCYPNRRNSAMTTATSKTRPFRVHLIPERYDDLKRRAKSAGVSMSQWINDAITARLEREG